jgi:hypothetical protein
MGKYQLGTWIQMIVRIVGEAILSRKRVIVRGTSRFDMAENVTISLVTITTLLLVFKFTPLFNKLKLTSQYNGAKTLSLAHFFTRELNISNIKPPPQFNLAFFFCLKPQGG